MACSEIQTVVVVMQIRRLCQPIPRLCVMLLFQSMEQFITRGQALWNVASVIRKISL